MNDAAFAALVANYGVDHNGALADIIEDITAGTERISVRNGVVRVGDGKHQDGTTWYYRGHRLEWGCGRFATRYVPAGSLLGGYDTIRDWKKAVDAKFAR